MSPPEEAWHNAKDCEIHLKKQALIFHYDIKVIFLHFFFSSDWFELLCDWSEEHAGSSWPGSNIKRFVSKFMKTFKTILQCYLIQINIFGQFITIIGATNAILALYSSILFIGKENIQCYGGRRFQHFLSFMTIFFLW